MNNTPDLNELKQIGQQGLKTLIRVSAWACRTAAGGLRLLGDRLERLDPKPNDPAETKPPGQ